jgi:hypothetical protein
MFLAAALFGGLIFGGISAILGAARGINAWGCFFLGLFFGPIGLLFAVLAPAPSTQSASVEHLGRANEEAAAAPTPTTGSQDLPSSLAKLADLHDRGALTDQEFASAKASLLR